MTKLERLKAEKAFWLELAAAWDIGSMGRMSGYGFLYTAVFRGRTIAAICHVFVQWQFAEPHPESEDALRRLRAGAPQSMGRFWWPNDESGAKCRATFCRKLAAQCETEIRALKKPSKPATKKTNPAAK
ncbi:MAG: hypothetical protein ACREQ5_02675 [Candidatus Dormibacteria bacterium]